MGNVFFLGDGTGAVVALLVQYLHSRHKSELRFTGRRVRDRLIATKMDRMHDAGR